MKGRKNRHGATRRRGDGATRVSALLFVVLVCLFTFILTSSAHEPITTKVRFNKELVRILQRSCLGCHHPGGIAFSLATYDEARPWAKAIKEEVLEKRMPPWHAVKGYGDFSNAPSLAQRDIDLIVNWVEGGAPKGEDKDVPAGPLFSNDWQLGKPDLILKPEVESKVGADSDEYRTFMLPTNLKEDRWIKAIDLVPGNASVVHCATVYISKEQAKGRAEANIMRAPEEALEPSAASSVLRKPTVLASWVPGQKTVALGEGMGFFIPSGSRLVARIHYHSSSEATTDRTAVGLYFARNASEPVLELALSAPEPISPTSSEPNPIKLALTTPADVEAISIRPSVHPLIVSLQATAFRPDGSQEVLLWSRGYHFDWEPAYYFRRPVALPKGTRVEVIVYMDNSDENPRNPNHPPKVVLWSELTAGPLCTLIVKTTG